MNKYDTYTKVCKIIDSCETRGQIEGMAYKVWRRAAKVINDPYLLGLMSKAWENKKWSLVPYKLKEYETYNAYGIRCVTMERVEKYPATYPNLGL